MRPLFKVWDEWTPILSRSPLSLFLDFDGTLVPLAPTPGEVRLEEGTRHLLRDLAFTLRGRVSIVSGRSLSDLMSRVGLAGLTYAGNHGLELEGPWTRFESRISEKMERALRQAGDDLTKEIAGVPGVLIEDKGVTLSVHYRLAAVDGVRRVRACVRRVLRESREKGLLTVVPGKKVLEVRPAVPWDKGRIVEWILMRQRVLQERDDLRAIYVGDDRTDEDAFRVILPRGLAIRVGETARSIAPTFVDDVSEVHEFLERLVKTIQRGRS